MAAAPNSPDSRSHRRNARSKRVRFAPAAIVGGVAASAVIALSMNGTLAGFVAQITNDTNTAATGYLTMSETQGSGGSAVTCTSNSGSTTSNAATCSTINKYGGSTTMVPGTPVSTTVVIKNTGTVPANTFTLKPGACSQSNNGSVNGNATDACDKFTLGLTQDGTNISAAGGALSSLNNKLITLNGPIAPNASSTFVFTVTLPTQNTAQAPTADNAYQGLKVSQALVWQFVS